MPKLLRTRPRGFTLLELMVVVAIIALASAAVSLSLRDSTQSQLEREALRLSALLEAARAQSRSSGQVVQWQVKPQGFGFSGLPADSLPTQWLNADTAVTASAALLLGPEPIIGKQSVTLFSRSQPDYVLRVFTDGLRPFTVQPGTATPQAL